ncbi:MAG: ComEC/Rec2 family competence protein [Acutalibacteraceae bacterium]
MKRPLCVIGFSLLCSLFVLCEADSVLFTVILCGLCAFAAVVYAIFKKKRSLALLTVIMTVSASCVVFLLAEAVNYYPALSLVSNKTEITAVVTDYPVRAGNRYKCFAKISLPDSNRKVKIRLSLPVSSKYSDDDEDAVSLLKPGDTVSFQGNIYRLGSSLKSAEQSFKSKKVFIGAYPTSKVSVVKADKIPLQYTLKHERKKVINQLLSAYDSDTAGIGISVLLGDKTYLSDEIYSDFRNAGVSHIMAVSGLHLSVWVMFLLNLAGFFGLDKKKAALFLMLFVFVIMSVTCFSGSVVRAGIMMLLYLFGFFIGEKPDALNSLGFSAVLFLLFNPFCAVNISFLLSFVSTVGVVTVGTSLCDYFVKVIEKRQLPYLVKKFLSAVISCICISISVSVFTFPITVFFFGKISVVSVLTNLLFLPVVTPMIVCFGLYVMFYFLPILSDAFFFLSRILSLYCRSICGFIASWKHSTLGFDKMSLPFMFCIFAVLFVLVYYALKKKEKFISILTAAAVFLGCFCVAEYDTLYSLQHVCITVYNVGTNLCVGVSQGKETVLLFAESDAYYAQFILDEAENVKNVILPLDDANVCYELVQKSEKITANENLKNQLDLFSENVSLLSSEINFKDSKLYVQDGAVTIHAFGVTAAVTKEKAQKSDIIITDNAETALDNQKNCCIIFSSQGFDDDWITTAQNSDIKIYISKNGKYFAKGENSWRNLMKSS